MMNLEIQEGVSMDRVLRLLTEHGAAFGDCQQTKLSGSLPGEGCYFVFSLAGRFPEVIAENAGLHWGVGVRGSFFVAPRWYDENMVSIRKFLIALESSIEQEFVQRLRRANAIVRFDSSLKVPPREWCIAQRFPQTDH